jgi:hypothetical protein
MMEGSKRRLQEGEGTRRGRRHLASAQGFLPTLPSAPRPKEGTKGHPPDITNERTHLTSARKLPTTLSFT